VFLELTARNNRGGGKKKGGRWEKGGGGRGGGGGGIRGTATGCSWANLTGKIAGRYRSRWQYNTGSNRVVVHGLDYSGPG